jgi:hypothetical protein
MPGSRALQHLKKDTASKGLDTTCMFIVHTAVGERGYILLAVERDTPDTSIVLAVKRDTTGTYILLVVERDTLGTPILLAVERDTPGTSILLAVEGDTQCMFKLLVMVKRIPKTHSQTAAYGVILCYRMLKNI